jgi:hypothetical protein
MYVVCILPISVIVKVSVVIIGKVGNVKEKIIKKMLL